MKRVFSIALLLLFLYNIAGTLPVFIYQHHLLEVEMNARLQAASSDADYTTFDLSPAEYNSITWDAANEFVYQGKMYDLVSLSTSVDHHVHICCINDRKEKDLFYHFSVTERNKLDHSSKSKSPKTCFKVLNDLLTSPFISFLYTSNSAMIGFMRPDAIFFSYPEETESPPPKLV